MPVEIEIVAVGDELLRGCFDENNSNYISRKLNSMGIRTSRISVVPDDEGIISDAITESLSRSDIVIVTGGLGPTADDVTRQAAIAALGGRIEVRKEVSEQIEKRFAAFGKKAPSGYDGHIEIPFGAEVISNSVGVAPGLKVEREGKLLYLLPGVPAEMKEMLSSRVLPDLARWGGDRTLLLRVFGLGESDVEDRLSEALGEERIASLSIISGVTGVDCYFAPGNWDEDTIALAVGALGSYLYAQDDMTMEELCLRSLVEKGAKLATAESVTGGLLASRIIGVPGASDAFLEGFITYSNEAKTERLGVSPASIEESGAVSADVCVQMAEGARARAGSDVALSTTGIAGPGGATEGKPVGYCFIGLATARASYCLKVLLGGGREAVRGRAASVAIDLLRLELEGHRERLVPLIFTKDDRRSGS
jgi:nicotinamide-nucleotide amidase